MWSAKQETIRYACVTYTCQQCLGQAELMKNHQLRHAARGFGVLWRRDVRQRTGLQSTKRVSIGLKKAQSEGWRSIANEIALTTKVAVCVILFSVQLM